MATGGFGNVSEGFSYISGGFYEFFRDSQGISRDFCTRSLNGLSGVL